MGRKIPIAVNLSIRQLADEDFVTHALGICRQHNVPPAAITFELTESLVAENISDIDERLTELHQAGFRLSLDDFGTGFSNLSHLHNLPFDELKIDRTFISEITDASCAYPIIDAVLAMSCALGLSVVAEGVETAEQASYLWARECDVIQGFYYHRPMSKDELITNTSLTRVS